MTRFVARLVIFLLAAGPCTFGNWSRKTDELLGPVRTVMSESTRFVVDETGVERLISPGSEFSAYDEKGNLTRRTVYKDTGEVDHEIVLTYGSNGKTSEHAVYSSEGSLRNRYAYTYDARGFLVEDAEYTQQGLKQKGKYTYYPDGATREAAHYGPDDSLLRKDVYTYDAERPGWEYAHYQGDGTLIDRWVLKNDKETGKRHFWIYDSQGKMQKHQVTTLNGKEAVREQVSYGDGGRVSRQRTRFDSQGRITETTFTDNRGDYSRHVKNYDGKGNLVESSHYGKGDVQTQSTVLTYEFDKFGNWTQKTWWEVNLTTAQRRATLTHRRRITYD